MEQQQQQSVAPDSSQDSDKHACVISCNRVQGHGKQIVWRTSCLDFGAVDAAALPALQGAAGSLQQLQQGHALLLVLPASLQRVNLVLHSNQSALGHVFLGGVSKGS